VQSERGQASVEWIGLLLLVSLALAAALAFVPVVDGRPLGAAIARALVCAVKGDCRSEGAALRRAYGERDARLVRAHAPSIAYEPGTFSLPVDYRRCRSHRCSDAPDERDLDVHRGARGGSPATAFTHVLHRGGKTYIQYWLYYPDSPSTFMHSHGIIKRFYGPLGIEDPAAHPDDWEGYQVRIDADGRQSARSTRHGGYASCKGRSELTRVIVRNEGTVRRIAGSDRCEAWGMPNGWTRVSRGSHAGHIRGRTPGAGLRERSTTSPGIRLVPLETLDHDTYKPLPGSDIDPPWRKPVYVNPTADTS
jgi:hypothetical protein